MNQLWIVVAALVALLVFTRIRSRRRLHQPRQPEPSPGPRIQGYQVTAYVHPRMSAACLHDHGVQFGRGFRRKEGPALPHDAQCRCEVVPFTFTSSEVFNGALRRLGPVHSTIDGLSAEEAGRLIERLKQVEGEALPPDAPAYVAAVGPDTVAAPLREALAAFLAERYAYLHERNAANLSEPVNAEAVEHVKPS